MSSAATRRRRRSRQTESQTESDNSDSDLEILDASNDTTDDDEEYIGSEITDDDEDEDEDELSDESESSLYELNQNDSNIESNTQITGAPAGNRLYLALICAGILLALIPAWINAPNGMRLWRSPSSPATAADNNCMPRGEKLYLAEELSRFAEPPTILLAFLGTVYDVSNGSYYHPGGSYHFFAGRDATRAYLTGEFGGAELRDDIGDLEPSYFGGIVTWRSLYDEKYRRIGRVVGAFYDDAGCETDAMRFVRRRLEEADDVKRGEDAQLERFPPCNSEWRAAEGRGRVWCSAMSGGISRDWIGRPRQFFSLTNKSWRCACVRDDTELPSDEWCDGGGGFKSKSDSQPKPGVRYANSNNGGGGENCLWKHYPGCDSRAIECSISNV